MDHSFIVYLKNKTTLKFEYKGDVSTVVRTDKGFLITFQNGRSYNYGADKVHYYPRISRRENVRIYENGKLNGKYNTVDNYGCYLIFRNGDDCSAPVENNANIEICDVKKITRQTESVISYFRYILKQSNTISFDIPTDEVERKDTNQLSAEILSKAFDNIDIEDSRSVMSSYFDGINAPHTPPGETFIYPFGCNESQKLAVETALSNSISIIEGPPGTGKTQTILNIIANLILNDKTVAIVSNNNAAIFNVREKLAKCGYEMIVASLGNNSNKTSFFENLEEQTVPNDFKVSAEQLNNLKLEVRQLDAILAACFKKQNKLAYLKTALSDAEIEFSHIAVLQPLDQKIKSILDNKFHRKWTSDRALKLKNLLSVIGTETPLSFFSKLRLVLQYGVFDLKSIDQYREQLPIYVNHKFYEIYIAEIKKEIGSIEEWLQSNNEATNLSKFNKISKEIFNATLFDKYNGMDKVAFKVTDYRRQFNLFTARFPVILSSTLSLHNSIPKGHLFDYLIIDEASQVDIIKSALCFSCCRNAIVVGDSMQLTHIVDEQSRAAADQFQIKHNISPAYDYVNKNILESLKTLYGGNITSVLLKEHYRCHPLIIGYCNKKYYNNNLAIMTAGYNHPFRIIETNIAGERGNRNQRQIDETDLYIRDNYADDYTRVGVIAPYRNHANSLQQQLPAGTEADTIHKFQGREKDVIVFNTVKNNIEAFIDNPNLINVAVSRAVKEFIVVKPASMELPHGTNIGDMIRYICYTTNPAETIIKGRICSVFDLLYKEYNQVFTSFLSFYKSIGGSPAEIIIHKLLTEKILSNIQYASIDMVREYKLMDLVRDFQPFSAEEVRFIKNNSRIDFLLYNKMDKTPILAVEVDGVSFHDNALQQGRDNKKDRILETIGLPLIRLSTNGHNEEGRIIEKLNAAMGISRR
ncbi:Superfamily I DNA and/or RNA helicase [Chitinophaga jiangningensis]|uniref:Superfamily I DNA and/or RNA helicase n=1 Tax=Chitinophaga jiangningensis TaxID=1419482 RepID=A0A1M6YDA8_9BACT|nr:AAA domain-containing protein [Chitinophaga jiangningensis]SHL16132.1 Superfamily I DNA and/or RNA helicase [Chitinophaga jiangningensis]